MTDIESSRARELVGRAGDHAPPMPDFAAIVASAELQADPRPSVNSSPPRRRRLILVAAALLLLVSGTALLWSLRDQDAEQIITGDQRDPSPTIDAADDPESLIDSPPTSDPATWTSQSWPVLAGVEGLELRYALRGPAKSTGYTGTDGLEVNIQVLSGPDANFDAGPLAEQIEVNGGPGWMETSGTADGQPSTSLTWQRDGFLFTMRIVGPISSDQAIDMAQEVAPAAESDLPVTPVSELGIGTGEPFDVATLTAAGQQLTLQATTAEGALFFLRLGPDGGGPSLVGLEGLVEVAHSSGGDYYPDVATYGVVDQSVATLRLRMSDGSTENVEIQSRSLGYDVAFFLTIVEASSGVTAIEAYGEDEALLSSVDLSWLLVRPDPGLLSPPTVTLLQASVEGFVTDTLGWELTEDTIEETEPGAFVVTDSETGSRLRVTVRADGAGIASVAPDISSLNVAVDLSENRFALSMNGLDVDASSATLYVATRGAQIQRTLSEAQFADGSITIDLFAPTDEANLDYLLVFEDESGRVISAFSPA